MRSLSTFGILGLLLVACGTQSGATKDGPPGTDTGTNPQTDGGNPDGNGPDVVMSDGPAKDSAGNDTPPGSGGLFAYVGSAALNVFKLNAQTGALTASGSAVNFGGIRWATFDSQRRFFYAVNEKTIAAFSVNAQTGALTKINEVTVSGTTVSPTYLSIDKSDKWLFTSYYSSGHVTVHSVESNGGVGKQTDVKLVGYTAHSVVPDPTGKFVFVMRPEGPYVAQFKLDIGAGKLTANAPSTAGPGDTMSTADSRGPRHMDFHPNGKFAYTINEDSGTMSAYTYDSTAGTLTSIQVLPTEAAGVGTSCAHVAVHPSGKFLYGSNRGNDQIPGNSMVAYTIDETTGMLTLIGRDNANDLLRYPESFAVDPTGKFLIVGSAQAKSAGLIVYEINQTTGKLTVKGSPTGPAAPQFVGIISLP